MFALINLDEIDKYSAKGMASIENLMQIASVNTKKAYQQGLSELPRTASFIATSNRKMETADKEAMKGVKESNIWNLLKDFNFHKEHYENGNKYNVVKR